MPSGTPTIAVHQALFGYEDGHRLLASSPSLNEEAASSLLPLTDLAPGVEASQGQDYWTGVPLVAQKQYALMHTWTAPEMPRPGCVWTHVLLVNFSDLARFVDMKVLARQTSRPKAGESFTAYSKAISVSARRSAPVDELRAIQRDDALNLLRSVYAPRANGRVRAVSRAADEIIFALWSQQWPELRRSFSFRSTTDTPNDALGANFHLQVSSSVIVPDAQEEASKAEPWEKLAIDDLESVEPTDFRRFLWRYGPDIRRGRDRFRFLAGFYLSTRTERLADGPLHASLTHVAQTLPDPSDGGILKRDLITCKHDSDSILPETDLLDTLTYFVDHESSKAFPPPTPQDCEALNRLWPTHTEEILSLAERAWENKADVRQPIVDALAKFVSSSTFLSLTVARPNVRAALLAVNPAFLDSPELESVPQPDLSTLLDFIPARDSLLANAIVNRLLKADDAHVAAEMLRRFPDVTTRLVVEGTGPVSQGQLGVANAWLDALAVHPEYALNSAFMTSGTDSTALARLARVMGHDTPEVLHVGPLPWATAMHSGLDHLEGYERLAFLTFLLVATIENPARGCEPLLERSFEPVHRALENSNLPWDAFRMLTRHLPTLSWWDNWDNCRRLRIAVVRTYVEGQLDPQSFRQLTADRRLFEALTVLAENTTGGRSFINQVSA